jgi:hypothetical protein
MRIATLIIGLLLTVGLFIQSVVVTALSDAINEEETSAAGASGVLLSVMWLIAVGLVIPLPLVSMGLFLLGGLIGVGVGASSEFGDMTIWGCVSFGLAAFSFFGWRGKKKSETRQAERDNQLQQSLAAQQQMAAQLQHMQFQQMHYQQAQQNASGNPQFAGNVPASRLDSAWNASSEAQAGWTQQSSGQWVPKQQSSYDNPNN